MFQRRFPSLVRYTSYVFSQCQTRVKLNHNLLSYGVLKYLIHHQGTFKNMQLSKAFILVNVTNFAIEIEADQTLHEHELHFQQNLSPSVKLRGPARHNESVMKAEPHSQTLMV